MLALILSVLFSTSLVIFFKIFDRKQIPVFDAIVFNYWSAFLSGVIYLYFVGNSLNTTVVEQNWFIFAAILGFCFISVFTLTGETTKHYGVGVASIAMKLGLVFPVLLGFFIYDEPFTIWKAVGAIAAFIAVFLTSFSKTQTHVNQSKLFVFLPLVVFLGSGLCDSMAQYANKKLLKSGDIASFVSIDFLFAAIFGTIIYLFRMMKLRTINTKAVFWGLLLGIPNFLSFFFLLQALDTLKWGSATIFMVINISIVCCSVLSGMLFFGEKLSVFKSLGLLLALVSILFMSL